MDNNSINLRYILTINFARRGERAASPARPNSALFPRPLFRAAGDASREAEERSLGRRAHPWTKPLLPIYCARSGPADNFCALLGLAAASTYRCVAPVKETQRAEHSYGLFGL